MSIHFHKNVFLTGLASYVPERVVSNKEIIDAHSLRIKDEWISGRIGISHRRWAADDEAASDLAVKAMQKIPGAQEAALYVSTISPDYLTPSTASLIKQKLQWKGLSSAIDMSAACAGHIFSMEQAAFRLQATSDQEVYSVATEVRSRYLNRSDRRTVFLFGDGACALRFSKQGPGIASLDWTSSQTWASDDFEILVPAGGSKMPLSQAVLDNQDQFIRMNDGGKIMDATTGSLVDTVKQAVTAAGAQISDYSFVVFHQGNGAIIRSICETLGLGPEKTIVTFSELGNSSSASCGIALTQAYERGLIKPGPVLMVTMGAGYHVGIASMTFRGSRP